MKRLFSTLALFAFLSGVSLHAVQMVSDGSFDSTDPIDCIPDWSMGWGAANDAANITGWNYVGDLYDNPKDPNDGASGTYLGNGWVLTAGHVGENTYFSLNGMIYNTIPNTSVSILNSDLTLFQIYSPPALPNLTLDQTTPSVFSGAGTGTQVAMIGFGSNSDPQVETWGYNTITAVNKAVTPQGYTYVSTDFFTQTGSVTRGGTTIDNNATVYDGDSGGGDFVYVYDSSTGTSQWELEGINEVTGSYTTHSGATADFSGMVQLSNPAYYTAINAIVATPEPPISAYLIFGLALAAGAARWRSRASA